MILVLGLGNLLMQDDGFGPRMVELLQGYALPPEVSLIDGGTLGLDLLPRLEAAAKVLLLDALDRGEPPGTLFQLTAGEIPSALAQKVSLHQAGVADLLAVAELRGRLPAELVLIGVQPQALDIGLELSPAVAAATGGAVVAVLKQLNEWGAGSSGE